MSREAMQMALEALNRAKPACFADTTITAIDDAITALHQALVDADDISEKSVDETAKREHEPVAFRNKESTKIFGPNLEELLNSAGFYKKREWVGLTDEELEEMHNEIKVRLMGTYRTEDIYRIIEAKLKEKNHG